MHEHRCSANYPRICRVLWFTHTLSLAISDAGKFIMSDTDMYGMNWERSTNSSGVTRGNLWIKAAVIVSMASFSFGEAFQ